MAGFDVVVPGAGCAGSWVAGEAVAAGRPVAVIEQRRVGGGCRCVACIPSKAMLASARARRQARDLARLGGAAPAPSLGPDAAALGQAVRRRDELSRRRDGTGAAGEPARSGITLIGGTGRVTGPGTVQVGDQEIGYQDLVIATGPVPVIAPAAGWTAWVTWPGPAARPCP